MKLEPKAYTAGAQIQKRLFAYIIDYFVGSIFVSLIPMLITSMITQETSFTAENFSSMPLLWQVVGGGAALLMCAGYFVLYPLQKKNLGQTFGKKVMRIRIVRTDGRELDGKTLLCREFLGSWLLESQTAFAASYIRHFLYLMFPDKVVGAYVLFTVAVSVGSVLSAAFGKSHRMLHDYVGGTVVVGEAV